MNSVTSDINEFSSRLIIRLWSSGGIEELPPDVFFNGVHPEDKAGLASGFNSILDRGSGQVEFSYRRRLPKGDFRWLKCLGRRCSDVPTESAGSKTVIFISEVDITDCKDTEQDLRNIIKIVQREHDEAETLRQISAAISSSLEMNETVNRILGETKKVVPYDMGTVQLLQGHELLIIGSSGFIDFDTVSELRFPYPEEGSLSTIAISAKKPVISNDLSIDFPRFIQLDSEKPVHSWIGIPLIRYGEVIGLMALDSHMRNAYSEHHVELAELIAVHVAIAIENARLHEKAYQMAMEDALTKTGSRYRFRIEGRILFETARRTKKPIAVIMFDIDHFKKVNDNHGHDAGDRVLERIAASAKQDLRAVDLIARYGGEEFVIMLPEADEQTALAVFVRINTTIRNLVHPGIPGRVTISSGIFSAVPKQTDKLEQFVSHADKAMYQSKNNGRNRISIFEG